MSREFYQGLNKKTTWPDTGLPYHVTFDDVNILQRHSDIASRSEIDLSRQFGPFHLKVPIMSAPMDTITGERMVRELARLGGIGVLPRIETEKDDLSLIRQLRDENIPFVASVGMKNGYEDAARLVNNGAQVVLVDVANGAMKQVWELAESIKKNLDVSVMAGNITTLELANKYKEVGIDYARVGVGGGAVCTTREKTGIGFPQLSAIFETKEAGIFVVADGGIAKPGSAAKALAAGADMVMIGTLFGATDEAPGEPNDKGMKVVRGQASTSYMEDNNTQIGEHRTAEGIHALVPKRGPVKGHLNDIIGGIKSSLSYVGARNLEEYYENAIFVAVSASTVRENSPHILSDIPGAQTR